MEPMATTDYRGLVKRLCLPEGFAAPVELVHDEVEAHAITRADLADDVRGINASLELIRRTRGGSWPTEPVTEEFNYVDLVWHECEFRDGKSFTYVLQRRGGGYLGCLYLYGVGTRTPLSTELLASDVDVSWWVTPEAYAEGWYAKAYAAIRHWMAGEFPFWVPHFSNAEIPGVYTVEASIDAPPARVFEVFTDPALFAAWFVVPGHSTPPDRVTIDARPGGGVEAVMVPDGGGDEVPFSVYYDEFEPPVRVKVRFSDHAESITVTLAPHPDGGTRCTYRADDTPPGAEAEYGEVTRAMHAGLAAALGEA